LIEFAPPRQLRRWALLNMRIGIRAVTVVLLLSLAGCDGFTHIKGKVVDANGKSIQGALVEMKTVSGGRDDQVKTDADGSFSVGFTHAPFNVDLAVTVSKEGYNTFEKRFKSADAKQLPTTITLEVVPSVEQRK
jgi:hypothetical protein